MPASYTQGRNEVRWRPEQKTNSAPPWSKFGAPMIKSEFFRRQIYCIEESNCDIVGTFLFGASSSNAAPLQWFSAPIVNWRPGNCAPHSSLRPCLHQATIFLPSRTSNLLGFVAKEPNCLQHAVSWGLHICFTQHQRSPFHRVGTHGFSNWDTHLYQPHNNSSVHLTTTTTKVRGSGRITDGMRSGWTILRESVLPSPTSAPTLLEWPCQESVGPAWPLPAYRNWTWPLLRLKYGLAMGTNWLKKCRSKYGLAMGTVKYGLAMGTNWNKKCRSQYRTIAFPWLNWYLFGYNYKKFVSTCILYAI